MLEAGNTTIKRMGKFHSPLELKKDRSNQYYEGNNVTMNLELRKEVESLKWSKEIVTLMGTLTLNKQESALRSEGIPDGELLPLYAT